MLVHSGREDMATMVSITGLIIVLLMVVNLVSDLFASVKNIFRTLLMEDAVKLIAIGIIAAILAITIKKQIRNWRCR